MQVVVAGAHGQIAMLLHPLLKACGHEIHGIIRNPDHAEDLRRAGVAPVVCDLETEPEATVARALEGADAVVFAAGAGPGSGAARKRTVDRDGAIKLIEAARRSGLRRYVMVSAMRAEQPRGDEVFQVYLQAKAEADAALRRSGLEWSIVRPGRLINEPARGRVAVAAELPRAEIPRADVAAVLAEVIEMRAAARHQFDVTSGDRPITEALKAALQGHEA